MNQKSNSIAIVFTLIHDIISRGLKISLQNIEHFSSLDSVDNESLEGLLNYIRALTSVVYAHHLTEDELAFPYFKELLPEAPFDELSKWHQVMVGVLNEINSALAASEKSGFRNVEIEALKDPMTRFIEMWHPHIQIEADEFFNKADAVISTEEQLRLVKAMGEHGQRLSTPPFLTVPFLLYNLPVEDRLVFSKDMPAEVLEHLVPVVWKDQWESMKPYLLP